MALAKVWNDNVHPFTQKFKGETITVPAKGYIEMPYEEAVSFKSKPSPMVFDGMGQQKPESFKKIRVEGRPDYDDQVLAYKCHADGSIHATKEALEQHVRMNLTARMADTDAQASIAKKKPAKQEASA